MLRRAFVASILALVAGLAKAQGEKRLDEKLLGFTKAKLLIVDELGYLPLEPDAWIDATRVLIDDSAARASRVARGREVAARYDWEAATDAVADACVGAASAVSPQPTSLAEAGSVSAGEKGTVIGEEEGSVSGANDGSVSGANDGSVTDANDGAVTGANDGSVSGANEDSVSGAKEDSVSGAEKWSASGPEKRSARGPEERSAGGPEERSVGTHPWPRAARSAD